MSEFSIFVVYKSLTKYCYKVLDLRYMRIENDFIGTVEIPDQALYGLHSIRAKENFPLPTSFSFEWYKALGNVKQACYETYRNYKYELTNKYQPSELPFQLMDDSILNALQQVSVEVGQGRYFEWFIVPAIQGGAGTSINMNVNEIIANAALLKLGKKPGQYDWVDPVEHANIFQSTNDVIPSSLKLCVIQLLLTLEDKINALRHSIEELEKKHRSDLRIGYTQMQEAVPTTFGRMFSTYNEALSRDWWRVSKCFERIKNINLGGSAIGTGVTVPRYFVMEAAQTLQRITGVPVTRSDNMVDATTNMDSLVEVHAILKSHAVNLEKMVADIRLLSSDISTQTIKIPAKQVGSSIMPGKVNPVIVEYIVSVAHKIYSNDVLISSLSAQGCLELNAYLPVIGNALIESVNLLIAANETLNTNLFNGLTIDTQKALESLLKSASVTTILLPHIGYHKATRLALLMKSEALDIFEANRKLKLVDEDKLGKLLAPSNFLKEGFTMNDFL